jgi:hypothetical protein
MHIDGLGHLKIYKDSMQNRTRDAPSCGALLQPAVPPLAPVQYGRHQKNLLQVSNEIWPDINMNKIYKNSIKQEHITDFNQGQ